MGFLELMLWCEGHLGVDLAFVAGQAGPCPLLFVCPPKDVFLEKRLSFHDGTIEEDLWVRSFTWGSFPFPRTPLLSHDALVASLCVP